MARAALLACLMAATLTFASPAKAGERVYLQYDGGAYGVIGLGAASLDFSLDSSDYAANATIKSGGLAALFERTDLRAHAEGAPAASGGLVNREYELDHAYSKKRRVTFLAREGAKIERLVTPDYNDAVETPVTDAQRAEGLDPLSTLLAMAQSVKKAKDCTGTFPVYDGRYRYDLTLRLEGADTHRGGGYDGPVLKCKLGYHPIAGYESKKRMRKRIPEGEIWFAMGLTETYAPPVRVSAPLPLGRVGVRLTSVRRPAISVADAPGSQSP